MIPIPSVEQIRRADQYTIEHEPVTSILLMERASKAFVNWFDSKFKGYKGTISVVCGPGNNGGDGLCISRLLLRQKYQLKVFLIDIGNRSDDCEYQKLKLEEVHPLLRITNINQFEFSEETIFIDAIFGSGLSRNVDGLYSEIIDRINLNESTVISVDIPSGLFADMPSSDTVIEADFTITFQYPKKSFLLPENEKFVGDLQLVDIGLLPDWVIDEKLENYLIGFEDIQNLLKPRSKFSHKGTFGHSFLIGGSYGKMGAIVLAAKAALRSGVGKVTVYIPDSGNQILQTTVPEAMTISDIGARNNLKTPPEKSGYDGIGIGPGMGMHEDTFSMLGKFLQRRSEPIVIDADAINILSLNKELLREVPKNSILTPHPGEFRKLAGDWLNDFDKLAMLRDFSIKHSVLVVLKGKYTSIAAPDGKLYFNPTGNPGMATAGSGDVLTGIITSFLAQGYSPLNSAIIGVYIHGLSGDLAAVKLGETSLISGDIIDYLPAAFSKLGNHL